MSVQRKGVGTLKTFTITMPSAREDNVTLNPTGPFTTNLPTTQTAGTGATFTLQQSDFPTISPSVPCKYLAIVYVSGKNIGTTQTVSCWAYKNGESMQSSASTTSPTANQYWMFSVYRFFDVAVGDVLELQIWANAANITLDYCAVRIFPTQVEFSKKGKILKDVNFSSITIPTLSANQTGSTLNNISTDNWQFLLSNVTASTSNAPWPLPTVAFTVPSLGLANYDWAARCQIGELTPTDTRSSYTGGHGSLRYYKSIRLPTSISFREISL